MQVGIDVGATKIESVVLEKDGQEKHRSRISCPKDYTQIVTAIRDIHKKLEQEFKKELPIGVCHPGVHSPQTGLVKNAPNITWLEKKPFQNDLRKALGKEVFCENDANCFALSESIDGSAKHYNFVFGVILGSGCGGGLVVNKKIVKGANNYAGEWGHNKHPFKEGTIEDFLSGSSLSRIFKKKFNKTLKTFEIFELYRKKDIDAQQIINEYKDNLAISLSIVVNILDPDAIVFGGGVSNEITFLDEIKEKVMNNLNVKKLNTVFIKPMYGDASGVRGAARLGRKINY